MKNEAAQPIVEVRNLKEYFNINMGMFRTKPLKAVDNVSFAIQPGETLGLVGESGCGKTTVGRTILHLYKPTGGEVLYKGRKIQTKADIQAFRNKASMVFQDPYSSLNPRMTVADIIGEPLDVHKLYSSRQERQERILELMAPATPTNFPAASASASASPARSRSTRTSSSATSRSPRWTCLSRRRSSTCSPNCRKNSA